MRSRSIFVRTKPHDGDDIPIIDRLVYAYTYMLSRSKGDSGRLSIPGVAESRQYQAEFSANQLEYEVRG